MLVKILAAKERPAYPIQFLLNVGLKTTAVMKLMFKLPIYYTLKFLVGE